MNLKHLSCIVDVDLCYDNIKYKLQAAQTSPNSYHLALNESSLEVGTLLLHFPQALISPSSRPTPPQSSCTLQVAAP